MSTTTQQRPTTDHAEARDRDRALVPLAMTAGLLVVIAVAVIGMGYIFLYVSRDIALMVAVVAAGGVLASIALLASKDEGELSGGQKFVAMLPAVVPVVLSAAVAVGLFGGLADEDRNINRLPLTVFPAENAVLVVAVNQDEFATGDLVLPASVEVGIRFDNEHAGVAHNVWIGTEIASGGAESNLFEGNNITGVETIDYIFEAPEPTEGLIYWCSIHPNMVGNVSFVADAEPSPPVPSA